MHEILPDGALPEGGEPEGGEPEGGEPEGGKPTIAAAGNQSQPTLADVGQEQRLHVATLWLPAVETLIGMIVPAVLASFFVGPIALLWFAGCFVLIPAAIYHAVRYATTSYQVDPAELVIRSGILFRRERRIPLDRVQEVKIEQGILHQLLGLAAAEVSTAGSDVQEAALNVLTQQEARRLKSAITARQEGRDLDFDTEAATSRGAAEFVFQLDFKTLLIGGFTSKVVATLGAIVSAIVYFQLFVSVGGSWLNPRLGRLERELQDQLPTPTPDQLAKQVSEHLPDFGPFRLLADLMINDTLAKSIALAFGGLIFTVATYAVRYFNFRLERSGDVIHSSYGLLTLRHGTLPRNRIQALKLEEGLLRRWFGLAAVSVDSAGDRNHVDENKNREVLLPVAARSEAEEVARQAIPGLTGIDPVWQRISHLAILRGSKKGWLLVLLLVLQTGIAAGWYWLAWLPAFPLVYLLNYQWYRHSGYSLSNDYFLWRSGWINRSTVCLPVRNIQNVSVVQNPFDRRLGLAALSVDIAGQSNTGGGPRIKHLPVDEARRIQTRLTDLAADDEFVW